MKRREIIAVISMIVFMNAFTSYLLKGDSILDPQGVIWMTGFFSGAIATRLLMEVLQRSTRK